MCVGLSRTLVRILEQCFWQGRLTTQPIRSHSVLNYWHEWHVCPFHIRLIEQMIPCFIHDESHVLATPARETCCTTPAPCYCHQQCFLVLLHLTHLTPNHLPTRGYTYTSAPCSPRQCLAIPLFFTRLHSQSSCQHTCRWFTHTWASWTNAPC